MKINYEFVTGEKLELEVDDSVGEIVIEMEVLQSRQNRTETRRHNSLESMQEQQQGHSPRQFVDEKVDVEQFIVESDGIILKTEQWRKLVGRLGFQPWRCLSV